jgi:hypothetical protein
METQQTTRGVGRKAVPDAEGYVSSEEQVYFSKFKGIWMYDTEQATCRESTQAGRGDVVRWISFG